jgi:hypothetical protein
MSLLSEKPFDVSRSSRKVHSEVFQMKVKRRIEPVFGRLD